MPFKDHFSQHASEYAKYRPRYPDNLFQYLASLVQEHERAWDCATGNGQAALSLTDYFDKILATDASEKQIKNATRHDKIKYSVSPAEQTEFESNSIDLITVAQALHWFKFDAFNKEVNRILKPDGVLAVWCYNLVSIESRIDSILHDYHYNIVGSYWPPERKLLEEEYVNIPFPFRQLQTPAFEMVTNWNLHDLLGYLNTWSSTQRFMAEHGYNPLIKIENQLTQAWGEIPESKKILTWPLHLQVGSVFQ